MSVLFKSYTTIDPFPQPSTMSGDITLPAAVLLRNDGCGYVIDTPLKITKAHRKGNLYLPSGNLFVVAYPLFVTILSINSPF